MHTEDRPLPGIKSYASAMTSKPSKHRGQRPPLSHQLLEQECHHLLEELLVSHLSIMLNSHSKPRVKVAGASKSLENVISRFCKVSGLKIERMTRKVDSGKLAGGLSFMPMKQYCVN